MLHVTYIVSVVVRVYMQTGLMEAWVRTESEKEENSGVE